MTTKIPTLTFFALVFFLASCSSQSGRQLVEPSSLAPAPVAARPLLAAAEFLGGAGEIDITPAPGMGMAGYSIGAKISRGFWGRLHARAFYLEDRDGNACALVSADLWAIPLGLNDRVTEILANRGLDHLRRDRLVVAATHTHHSAGNYDSMRFWNAFSSNEQGYDPKLFEYLAQALAEVVCRAAENPRRVRLERRSFTPKRFARCRSLEPALLDTHPAVAIAGPLPEPGSAARLDLERRIVRSRVDLLALVDAERNRPFAAMVFLAVHPTVMGTEMELLSADVFGIAMRRLAVARKLDVCACFNGAEGDVRADVERRDAQAALELGGRLGDLLATAFDEIPPETVTGSIRSAYARGRTADQPVSAADARRTSPRAMVGVATIGGATDGKTPLFETGFVPGQKGKRSLDQGSKRFALDLPGAGIEAIEVLFDLLSPQGDFPDEHQLVVLEIGSLRFATLPGEFTTELGRRVRRAVAATDDDAVADEVILVGLAGGYLFYVTTEEEYEAQHYEGASTLYGPMSGPFFVARIGELARSLGQASPVENRETLWSHNPGALINRDVIAHLPRTPLVDDGLANVLVNADGHAQRTHHGHRHKEPLPSWPPASFGGPSPWPRARVEESDGSTWRALLDGDGVPVDERGYRLVFVAEAADGDDLCWTVLYLGDDRIDVPGRRPRRFVVETGDGRQLIGPSF